MLDIISDYNTKLSDDINALYANIRGDNGDYLSHSYRAIECNELIERYSQRPERFRKVIC